MTFFTIVNWCFYNCKMIFLQDPPLGQDVNLIYLLWLDFAFIAFWGTRLRTNQTSSDTLDGQTTIFVFLSFCLSVFLYFYLSVFLSFCLSKFLSFLSFWFFLSFCCSVILFFCFSVFLSFCLSFFLSFLIYVFLLFRHSVFLSFCLSVFPSFGLSVLLFFCLFFKMVFLVWPIQQPLFLLFSWMK